MRTDPKIQVSKDAVRKLMRHGWNVYPLEAFGFLLGTTNPPCVYAALPTSKTAHWDSHADRWNGLTEKRSIADEVAALFSLQVVGVYATHEKGDKPEHFPSAFANDIVITYAFDWGTNESGVYGAALHAPGVGRDDWELSRGKRLPPEINKRRIIAAWRERCGPIDYSNNYETEYPRLYGIQPTKKERYAPPKKQERNPYRAPSPDVPPHTAILEAKPTDVTYRAPSPDVSPHTPPPDPSFQRTPPQEPLKQWHASRRVTVDTDFPLTEEQKTILTAIRNETPLTFRYIGGSHPGNRRTVSAKELFQVPGYSGCYLLAHDLDLNKERIFRLDRIDW